LAHNNLGLALKAQGKPEEAIAAFRAATRLQPDLPKAHYNLALVLVSSPKGSRTDHDEALVHARKAVELAPKVGICYRLLARAEYRLGHWTESLAAGEKSMALLQDGGDANIWFLMARAHWQRGHKVEARQCFDKGVAWTKRHAPQDSNLRRGWAEAAELLGQPGPVAAVTSSPAAPAVAKPH
jgi:superkiller protein 3